MSMKVTMLATDKVFVLQGPLRCRLWRGVTEDGNRVDIYVQSFRPCAGASIDELARLEREVQEKQADALPDRSIWLQLTGKE